MNLSSLYVVDNLYTYFDESSKNCLTCVCHRLQTTILEIAKYQRIASVIGHDYEILTQHPQCQNLWYLLKNCQVILCGEDHTRDEHRKKFASLVHQIWEKEAFAILLEEPCHLEYEVILNKGQRKYLNHDIALQGQGWDILEKDSRAHKTMQKAYYRILSVLQLFLKVRDGRDDLLDNLLKVTKKYMAANDNWEEALQAYPEHLKCLAPDRETSAKHDSCYRFKMSYLLFNISYKIHGIITANYRKIDESIEADMEKRDASLLNYVEKEIANRKRVIVNAGLAHVKAETANVKALQKRQYNFMSLSPKSGYCINSEGTEKAIQFIDPRGFLKSFEDDSVSHYEDLYRYVAANPMKVLCEEIKMCEEEYDLADAHFDKFRALSR